MYSYTYMCNLSVSLDKGDQRVPGKLSPRPQLVLQMAAVKQISFHDPIYNEQELRDKELLLGS